MAEPELTGKEKEHVNRAIDEREISGHSKYVSLFEERFAKFIGTKYALMLPNGTLTLHLALRAMGVDEDSEVIVPSQTISSCAFAISYLNATVVVVDVDPDTWCMDMRAAIKAISSKTKVIMPTHIYGGIPCKMEELSQQINPHLIYVLEDAAEALGSEHLGKKVGSLGSVGSFSFFANKIITSGEGGALTTSDDILYKRMKYLRNMAYGPIPETRFWANDLGYNYRSTGLQSSFALGQLEGIEFLLKRRQDIHFWYTKYLSRDFAWQQLDKKDKICWWMNAVLVPQKKGQSQRSEFMNFLADNGIESRPTFPPLSQHPYLKNCKVISAGERNSQYIWENGVLLPSGGAKLTEEKVAYVCQKAYEFLKR